MQAAGWLSLSFAHELFLRYPLFSSFGNSGDVAAISLGTILLQELFFFSLINLFILFLAALGLHCCTQALSSCGEPGLLFVVLRGLLITVASLVVEHRL